MDEYFARAADAFLTSELDDWVRALNSFVRESLETDRPVVRVSLSTEYRFSGLAWSTRELTLRSKVTALTSIPRGAFRLGLPGLVRMNYEATVLAAPIRSREFEARITTDLARLKYIIKEVTLGAHAT